MNTIPYQRILTQRTEIVENNIKLIVDAVPIPADSLNFYLRHLNNEIIRKIKVLQKKDYLKYGIEENTTVYFIETIAYKSIIKKDFEFFKLNYPKAIWIVNGKPYISNGVLLKAELKTELERIKGDKDLVLTFIYPDMASELFGSNTGGGVVIINQK